MIQRRRARITLGVAILVTGMLAPLLSTTLVAQAGPSAPPPLLTLSDAVALALEHAAVALDARDGVAEAQIALRVARAVFEPKASANLVGNSGSTVVAGQSYGFALSQRLPTGTELRASVGVGSAQNQLGTYFSSDTTFSLSQPVLSLFAPETVRQDVRKAEDALAAARQQATIADQRLAIEVAAAYYQIASQRQLQQAAEAAAARARRLRDGSQARLVAGKVSRLDVFRAEQLVTETELQVLDARTRVLDAEDRLRLLTGRSEDFVFSVAPAIEPPAGRMSETEAAELAQARRPDLAMADHAVRDAELDARMAGRRALPQIDLGLALKRQDTSSSFASSLGLRGFGTSAFVSASVPVDRTTTRAAVERADIQVGRARRAREELRAAVAREARAAVRNYDRLLQARQLVEAAVEQARQEAEVAQLRYDRGLSNNLDVTAAEGNLLAARARRADFLGQLAVAWLQVRAAAGVLDPRADVR